MKPLSSRRRDKQMGAGCLVPFFAIFLLAGLAASYFILWKPWSRWFDARSWQPTPCTVVSSQVDSSSDSDGTTYRVDITYSYVVEGAGELRGSNYDFMKVSSSGYQGKADIVARYPPGTQMTCWVNPENATESVMNRDFSLTYLFGLFPLIFVVVGGGGMTWALLHGRKQAAQKAAIPGGVRPSPFGVDIPADAGQQKVLKPQYSPFGKLIGTIFIALFWNGIVSVFLVMMIRGWQTGEGDGCLTAFLVPFVLIGLLLIYGVFHQFLVLFNPRLDLTLSRGILVLGESTLLQWKIEGRSSRVTCLKIVLEGREEATYRRGTDTKTDSEVFLSIPVVEARNEMQIAQGSARVDIPEDTMPSFSADRNKIVWKLKADCEIPGWPDSNDEYEVVVAPRR